LNFKFLKYYGKGGWFSLFLFVLMASSCKTESGDVGLNFLDQSALINSTTLSITDANFQTISMDTVVTSTLGGLVFGAQNDPIFGLSTAEIIVQPSLVSTGYNFSDATLDSIILVIPYLKDQTYIGNNGAPKSLGHPFFYGDISNHLNIDVYKVEEVLSNSKLYNQKSVIQKGDKVGSTKVPLNWNSNVITTFNGASSTEPPQLRIKLNQGFGQELLDQPAGTYSTNAAFQEFLKGLYLVPSTTNLNIGEGVFVSLNALSQFARLELYYQKNSSQKASFLLPVNSVKFTRFTVNETNNISEQKLAAPNTHFNQVFLQYMTSRVKCEIPQLKSFIDTVGKIMIHEAKIKIKVLENTIDDNFAPPLRLNITKINPITNREELLRDLFSFENRINSFYQNGEYIFYFNREMQAYIDQMSKNDGNNFNGFLFTIPNNFPLVPSRLVFNTEKNTESFEIFIRYTKL